MLDDPELRRLLWYLLGGTRGGENRARIIHEIALRPANLNQLSVRLGLDYRAIQHHIEILKKNNLVIAQGGRYGLTYFLNQWFEAHIDLFREICFKLNFKFDDEEREKREEQQQDTTKAQKEGAREKKESRTNL